MTAINPSYYHYVEIIKGVGRMAATMPKTTKRRLKCDRNGYLYYDGQVGKIYVGQRDMVSEKLFTIEGEAEEDMRAIHGLTKRTTCDYCNGYGTWPGDYAPFTFDEITWDLSEPCEKCGSNNHLEYMTANRGCEIIPPWEPELKSIGLGAAMEKFKRNALCVESLDTQETKTAQE